MSEELRISAAGAFIHRYNASSAWASHERWAMGSLILGWDALELVGKTDRATIPIKSIVAVEPPDALVPHIGFEERLAIRHREATADAITLIAFPRYTVRNFPLQLAAALTGSVKAFVPQRAANGQTLYEEARFGFHLDHFELVTRTGSRSIPLDKVSSLTPARRKDANGKEFAEAVIDHLDGNELRHLTILSYERLPFLWTVLTAVARLRNGASARSDAVALSEAAQMAAVMLYTGGVDGGALQQALGLDADRLDAVYEELLKAGLADVVRVRKEIALNAAGVKAVDDIVKRQTQTEVKP